MKRTETPTGTTPPQSFEFTDGTRIDLGPLAERICHRYYEIYPDDLILYGEAGRAWCEHDSRYLLAWALEDARAGSVDCVEQVQWLARIFTARCYPVERLATHVELAAAALRGTDFGRLAGTAAVRLDEASSSLRDALSDHLRPTHDIR